MALPVKLRSLGPVAWYYLATPVFFLLDALWGINIRVAALDDTPALKYLYYVLCLAGGVVTTARPGVAGLVGVAESSVNILLVVLGVMLPYYRVLQAILDGQDVTNPYTPTLFVNFFLSGAVWVTALYRHQMILERHRSETRVQ